VNNLSVLVSIPVLNERLNLELLIPRLLTYPELTIFVVDDDSSDGTNEFINCLQQEFQSRVMYVRRDSKLGFASAHLLVMRFFLNSLEFENFLQMDADLSHRTEDLSSLLIHANKADLIVGSRYIEGGMVTGWPKKRLLLSRVANILANFRLNLRVKDATSGYRLMSRELVELILKHESKVEGYVFQVQNVMLAKTFGLKVIEVPINFVERAIGKSKMNWKIILEALIFILFQKRGKTSNPS
jgi:glycosyltransferase involved in cell wall biosynthesis